MRRARRPDVKSGVAHSTVANVPDLDRFVRAVLAYTGAKRVDIVGHSLGVTLARDVDEVGAHAAHLVRRLVAIDGPNHGIVDCSPSPANYFQLPALGGFTPSSAICQEYGSPDTPFLSLAEQGPGDAGADALPRDPQPRTRLRLRLGAGRFFPPVPAEDSAGLPHDFSDSATLVGARRADLDGPGRLRPVPRHEPSRDPRVAGDLGRARSRS